MMKQIVHIAPLLLFLYGCSEAEIGESIKEQSQMLGKGSIRRTENALPDRYIVVLKDSVPAAAVPTEAVALATAHGGALGFVYQHALKGFSIETTEAVAMALSLNPHVDYVVEDGEIGIADDFTIQDTQVPAGSTWGLDRIDQRYLPLNNIYSYGGNGTGVHVYVIDTGIRTTHNEFGGRASVGADFIGGGWNGQDCNGHGTHVSGTIGGASYGVARNVKLHSVRVLNCSGSGTFSGVIAGVNWVTANRILPAVANMSLGATTPITTLDTAVQNSIAAGVTYTIAAGNSAIDANSATPARTAQALTVGATDSTDHRAWFSNYGPLVDVFAPGVGILSATSATNTSSAYYSGTSMAAPHVAGVVAAVYLDATAHPSWTPAQVATQLVSDATADVVFDPAPGSPNRLLYGKSSVLLTVTPAGEGGGYISSSPSGISCPSTCTHNFDPGQVVTLYANADQGSGFAYWSGACSGSGNCQVTMSQAKDVTANFYLVAEPYCGDGGCNNYAPYWEDGCTCSTDCPGNPCY